MARFLANLRAWPQFLVPRNTVALARRVNHPDAQSSVDSDHIKEDDFEDDAEYEQSIKQRILNAALPFVPQMGWSKDALATGADTLGYPGIVHGVFPEGGVALAHHFYEQCNSDLALILQRKQEEEGNVRTMAFINEAVETRLKMNIQFMDEWAEALALMGMPPNAPRSVKLLATLVDDIWHHAGDTATDFSWYTKRAMLAGVYQTTELYMLQDKSRDFEATWEFLDRRMQDFKNIRRGVQNSQEAASLLRSGFETAKNMLGYNASRR